MLLWLSCIGWHQVPALHTCTLLHVIIYFLTKIFNRWGTLIRWNVWRCMLGLREKSLGIGLEKVLLRYWFMVIVSLVTGRSWGRNGLLNRRKLSLRKSTLRTATGMARVIVDRFGCTRATPCISSCSGVLSSCAVSSTNSNWRLSTSSCMSRKT